MEWLKIAAPLMPTLAELVKDIVIASKGNDQIAIGILMGILGYSEENKTRAAIVIANARAMAELGPQ